MSKSFGPTFNVHTFSAAPYPPQDVSHASGSQNTQFSWSLTDPSSTQLKTPATLPKMTGDSQSPPVVLPPKRSPKPKKRMEEELDITRRAAERFSARLAQDHIAVLQPDADTPFSDSADVVRRLLPYHIYHQPCEDLEPLTGKKGKQRATDADLKKHNEETRFALECYRRYDRLRSRFRRAKIHTASRASPDDQAYVLAQAVLEADRLDASLLSNELKAARGDLERLEREKRAATTTASRTQYTTAAPSMSTVQTQYYRPYPYAYTQVYGTVVPPPTTSTFQINPPPPPTPNRVNTAIPVQLPVASLPALHALGIHPVPASSLAEGQTPPPAVLRGSTANGTILTLEINVSLLQSAQMSGLAMVLNSLMSRSSTSTAGAGQGSSAAPPGSNHEMSSTPKARNSLGSSGSTGGTQ